MHAFAGPGAGGGRPAAGCCYVLHHFCRLPLVLLLQILLHPRLCSLYWHFAHLFCSWLLGCMYTYAPDGKEDPKAVALLTSQKWRYAALLTQVLLALLGLCCFFDHCYTYLLGLLCFSCLPPRCCCSFFLGAFVFLLFFLWPFIFLFSLNSFSVSALVFSSSPFCCCLPSGCRCCCTAATAAWRCGCFRSFPPAARKTPRSLPLNLHVSLHCSQLRQRGAEARRH